MKNLVLPVGFSTFFVCVLTISPYLGFPLATILTMLALSPLVMIWLVLYVLKYGVEPKEKFSDGYWYSDVKYAIGSPSEDEDHL
jgi:hypothetical protein